MQNSDYMSETLESNELTVEAAPEWLVTEMPHGYQNRVAEIQRLSGEMRAMDRIGRLLWAIGPPLAEAVREVFTALKLEIEPTARAAPYHIAVRLDARRRLLLTVSQVDVTIEKKSREIGQLLQTVQEVAGDGDRVILAANTHRSVQPADRPESTILTPDALNLVSRMGANVVTTTTLFRIWNLSLQDQERARAHVEKLYEQDGGVFSALIVAGF